MMIAWHPGWVLIVVYLGLGFVGNSPTKAGQSASYREQSRTDNTEKGTQVGLPEQRWEVRLEAGELNSKLYPRFSPVGTRLALMPAKMPDLDGFDHLEGQLRLGAAIHDRSGQRFVIARSQKGSFYDLLFIDFDHDGSLVGEVAIRCQPRRSREKWWSSFQSSVQVKLNVDGTVLWQDYPLSFWAVVDEPDETPQEIRFTRTGFRTGKVRIGGTDYDVILSDGNNDGLFAPGDSWTIQPVNIASPSRVHRRVGDFNWVDNKAYLLELADSTGTRGWVVRHDPGITQEEDQQTRDMYREDHAAPRAMRPVVFRYDVDQAIADARAEETPYFLDFETSWCGPCRQMDQLVYTAQPVVDAAKGIICIKVDGDIRKDLVDSYQVKGYPTGILSASDGREMRRFIGYRSVKYMARFLDARGQTPDDIQSLVARMESLKQNRSWSTIEEEATAWMTSHPQDASALAIMATPRIASRSDPQSQQTAEHILREALVIDPNSARVLQLLAMFAIDAGRHTEAIRLNRRLLEIAPNDATALNNLAWSLAEHNQDYEQALALTTRGLVLAPDDADLLDTHGVVCLHLKRLDEAQKYLTEAVRLVKPASPGAAVVRYHLAEVYEANGQDREAAGLFEKSLNLHGGIRGLTPAQVSHAKEFLNQWAAVPADQAISGATALGSADASPPPSSGVAVVSADKLLRGTWAWDIDNEDDTNQQAVDLWWEHVNEHERYLVPRNGTQLAVVKDKSFEGLTLADLSRIGLARDRIAASDYEATIDVGTILAVRTTEANLAKLEVLGFDSLKGERLGAKYDMRLRYTLYRTVGSPSTGISTARRIQTADSNESDHSSLAGQSISVNDRRLYESFQAGLAGLIESNRSARIDTLTEQLQRDHTSLALPKMATTKMNPAKLYQNCRNSVVVVGHLCKCAQCGRCHPIIAAGFFVTASGVIVTNYHVASKPDSLAMGAMTWDGRVYPVREVLAADKESDVAILQLEGAGFTPLALSSEAPTGTPVAVIGHPGNKFYTLTTGIVSRHFTVDSDGRETTWIAATAEIGAGSSGAPMLNECGAVVGFASQTQLLRTARPDDHQAPQMTIGWFVPASAVLQLVSPDMDGKGRSRTE
ncbi:MAG: trypsin-like peptidase domain-containing protein [Phycisphaerae bacterium]|nr:trypsin-like peptidase domain-containing protein [Phycisphaerae bacterium]